MASLPNWNFQLSMPKCQRSERVGRALIIAEIEENVQCNNNVDHPNHKTTGALKYENNVTNKHQPVTI